jgi:uncharacterized protein (DUF58 family)
MYLRFPKLNEDWHQWFAWRPVFTSGGIAWLEPVWRRWSDPGTPWQCWEYEREKPVGLP